MILRSSILATNLVTRSLTTYIRRNARTFAGRLARPAPRDSPQSTLQHVTASQQITNEKPPAIEKENYYALSTEDDIEFLESFGALSPVSFNLAPYANKSDVIQQLIKLGVDLSKVEEDRDMAIFLIHANFERHIKPHLIWLVDHGIKPKHLSRFITQYPRVFNETLQILDQRIEYLSSKKFSRKEITEMLNKYPLLLKYCFTEVDAILGFIQKEYSLTASQVRGAMIKFPSLVSLETMKVREQTFAMKEEMGWSMSQMRHAVCEAPCILAVSRQSLVNIFDYLTNRGEIPKEWVVHSPEVLAGDLATIKKRLGYLKKLKRDQFDLTEPLYVPLTALSQMSDSHFATRYAKSSLEDYDLYLKTL